MNWIKIEEQLPPKNTLVWVKRQPNKVEQEPMYLAMRNGNELSKNPDASANCHWYGIHSNALDVEQKSHMGLEFGVSFSDVTVIEWAFIERPS
jgi:hypothetical protein